jgi:hypothetical protein
LRIIFPISEFHAIFVPASFEATGEETGVEHERAAPRRWRLMGYGKTRARRCLGGNKRTGIIHKWYMLICICKEGMDKWIKEWVRAKPVPALAREFARLRVTKKSA